MKRIVVALGGNALQAEGKEATAESQLEVVKETAVHLADLIEEGYEIVIAHGNGPQVGRIVIQNEYASEVTPAMPFDVCGAMSQGMIGYHIQQGVREELMKKKINKPVVSLITQVVVDKDDPAFKNPTKPIGPFYEKDKAEGLQKEKDYVMVEDSGRGYRRVVASPKPEKIIEVESIKTLINNDTVVITVGGGGIPVVELEDKSLKGVAAVIDKDFASEKLAEDIDADELIILTGVDRVAINYGKPNQINLDKLTVEDAKRYIEEGYFANGSMLPKVEAALKFAESKKGRKAIIASLDKAKLALRGESGTIITLD
ncbi:carbamate kinase [Clostridium argentinense CDC 2741]|uniref:Carbamate kinase n=1 Tax=Clostridium argentinense CDC 2741 TaxID=1418104 RepID=A0A0C1R793_9CLOT|nr:carbamate kinase [Clostridium argentinense]ARC86082.1 carbamate kinase [Clostridium argentinense]KIE46366.1 carbamate kinase [Clostridium argentinense CDC 2741]NFF39023.1 carbamate kinase [Clostridium argentinense]NFP48815.1 carbamate kinase [Clostridium argentinense]NFP70917.1 carbamate kinase [Clostridium argentinense]